MRAAPALALAFAGTAAQAERLAFDCQFTTRCDDYECVGEAVAYVFRADTATGSGEMVQDGLTFPLQHLASGGMEHFVFVNDAGSELISIADSGQVIYSGHMTIDGQGTWYRLEGQCTRRSK